MNKEVDMEKKNITALEEKDQIYSTLTNHSITLSEVYEKEKNYFSLAWVLISEDKSKFLKKKVDSLIAGMKHLSNEYLKEKKVNTNLFVSLAVTCYVCKQYKKNIPSNILKAVSAVLEEVKRNIRLRTVEMVGTILFFLKKSSIFEKELSDLEDYLRSELKKAIRARNYAQVVDAYFGIFQPNIDDQYYEQVLSNKKLLNGERLAKALITLSITKNSLKDKAFLMLKKEFKEKYFLKLDKILQAVINGLSLIESNLNDIEVQNVFNNLKDKEWTKIVDVEKNKLNIKKIGYDITQILNPKLIGLSLLAYSESERKTKFSLNTDQYKEMKSAWMEKRFGFGLKARHFQFFYYFSLLFMIVLLAILVYTSGAKNEIINIVSCIQKKDWYCLISLSFHAIAVLIIVGIIITYHRTYKLLTKEGQFKNIWEIIRLVPVIGTIIKNISGEK